MQTYIRDRSTPMLKGTAPKSQGLQERHHLLLLVGAQIAKAFCDVPGFRFVATDCVVKSQGIQIMHEPRFDMQSPQRRRPKLIDSVRRAGLQDAVAGTDIVEQKIAVGMNVLVTQSRRNGVGTAV